MGCGESKHAVATANTTVAKSKSKRSESNNNPPVQNAAANEYVNVTENEIPEAIFEKKEAETLEDGKKNTLAEQEDIRNRASGEEGEGNMQTSSEYKTNEDGAKNQELEIKGCVEDRENVNVAGGDEEEKALNSCDHSHDPQTKNEEGLKLEDKVSTSVGEEKNANATCATTDTKAN